MSFFHLPSDCNDFSASTVLRARVIRRKGVHACVCWVSIKCNTHDKDPRSTIGSWSWEVKFLNSIWIISLEKRANKKDQTETAAVALI